MLSKGAKLWKIALFFVFPFLIKKGTIPEGKKSKKVVLELHSNVIPIGTTFQYRL